VLVLYYNVVPNPLLNVTNSMEKKPPSGTQPQPSTSSGTYSLFGPYASDPFQGSSLARTPSRSGNPFAASTTLSRTPATVSNPFAGTGLARTPAIGTAAPGGPVATPAPPTHPGVPQQPADTPRGGSAASESLLWSDEGTHILLGEDWSHTTTGVVEAVYQDVERVVVHPETTWKQTLFSPPATAGDPDRDPDGDPDPSSSDSGENPDPDGSGHSDTDWSDWLNRSWDSSGDSEWVPGSDDRELSGDSDSSAPGTSPEPSSSDSSVPDDPPPAMAHPLNEEELQRIAELLSGLNQNRDAQREIKVPKLEKATANDWIQWRQTFERIAALKGWDDEFRRQVIVGHMRGDAVLAVANIRTEAIPAGPGVIAQAAPTSAELLDQYERKFVTEAGATYARQMFRQATQEKDEELTTFHTRVIQLYRRAHPGADLETTPELIERFIFGLHNRLVKEYVFDQQPANMTDALRHANVKMATYHAMTMNQPGGSKGVHGIQEGGTNAINVTCWTCGEKGHMRDECPQKGKAGGSGKGGGKWKGGQGKGKGGQGKGKGGWAKGGKSNAGGNTASKGGGAKRRQDGRRVSQLEEAEQELQPEGQGSEEPGN
jgi:uncharacterized membrane protein YgcG